MFKMEICRKYLTEIFWERAVYFTLFAAVFCLPLFPKATTIFLQAGVLLALTDNIVAERFKMTLSYSLGLFFIFIALAGLSLFNSPNFAESLYNYQVLIPQYVYIYWLTISYTKTTKDVCGLIVAILISATFVTFYGLYQYFYDAAMLTYGWVDPEYFPELTNRVFSTLENPNILAAFLVTVISLCTGGLLALKNLRVRFLLGILALASIICLIFTFSRGAWVSLFIALFVVSVIYNYKVLFALLPAGLVIGFFAKNLIVERFISTFQNADTSVLLRFAIWESTRVMIERHLLTGIGWGAYKFVYPEYDFFINNPEIIIYHAHNMYLNIAAELGIPALIVFIVLMLMHFYFSFKALKKAQDNLQKACTIGLMATFIGVFIGGLTDYTLFNMEQATLFWLLSALAVSLYRQQLFYINK